MANRKVPGDKRKVSLHIRPAESQKQAIEKAARRTTLDPSVWARMLSLHEAGWDPDANGDG